MRAKVGVPVTFTARGSKEQWREVAFHAFNGHDWSGLEPPLVVEVTPTISDARRGLSVGTLVTVLPQLFDGMRAAGVCDPVRDVIEVTVRRSQVKPGVVDAVIVTVSDVNEPF